MTRYHVANIIITSLIIFVLNCGALNNFRHQRSPSEYRAITPRDDAESLLGLGSLGGKRSDEYFVDFAKNLAKKGKTAVKKNEDKKAKPKPATLPKEVEASKPAEPDTQNGEESEQDKAVVKEKSEFPEELIHRVDQSSKVVKKNKTSEKSRDTKGTFDILGADDLESIDGDDLDEELGEEDYKPTDVDDSIDLLSEDSPEELLKEDEKSAEKNKKEEKKSKTPAEFGRKSKRKIPSSEVKSDSESKGYKFSLNGLDPVTKSLESLGIEGIGKKLHSLTGGSEEEEEEEEEEKEDIVSPIKEEKTHGAPLGFSISNNMDVRRRLRSRRMSNNVDIPEDSWVPAEYSNAGLAISLRYLGSGYNIVFGNPLGDPTIMVDPGYRNPVIALNWSKEYFNKDGANLKEPKGGWVRPELSCRQAESVDHINTVDEYKKELSVDARVSANVPFYFSFSASSGYKNFVRSLSDSSIETYILKMYCLRYVAGISDYSSMETTPEFKEAVRQLPSEFDILKCPLEKYKSNEEDPDCAHDVRPWMQFFNSFGTHFTTVIHLGGKVSNQVQVLKSEVVSLQKKGLSIDSVIKSNVGLGFAGFGAKANYDSNNESLSESKSLHSKKLTIVIGGDAPIDTGDAYAMREWTRSLYKKPMPIKIRLESIRKLIPDEKRKSVFDQALKYYSEIYGISPDEIYRIGGKKSGIASIIKDGKQVFSVSKGSSSAVCPNKTVIMMGFAFLLKKRGNFFSENDFSIELSACPIGEEKCVISDTNGHAEVRIWIVCGSEPVPLMVQRVSVEEGKQASASCPEGYSIAYGFGFSVPKGLDSHETDSYACRAGNKTCSHSSQGKTISNAVWITCAEDRAPELSRISNHVVSVSTPSCTENPASAFKDNMCPPNSTLISGWDMYLSESKRPNYKLFSSCSTLTGGCKIESDFSRQYDKCRSLYSWISCLSNSEAI